METACLPRLTSPNGSSSEPLEQPQQALIIADGASVDLAPLLTEPRLPMLRLELEPDPLAAITDHIQQVRSAGSGLDILHLVGHGQPGSLQLGEACIDRRTLLEAAPLLADWGVAQIVLWSCQVGSDPSFLSTLAELTGASVVATGDLIGVGHRLQLEDGAGTSLQLASLFGESAISRWGGTLINQYDAGNKQFDFNFSTAELLTDPLSPLGIGAKWRYKNVVTVKDEFGNDVTIDAIVSILDLLRTEITVLDSSTLQYSTTQFPEANSFFQPNIRFSAIADPSVEKGGYAEFQIDFVENFDSSLGAGNNVNLQNVKIDLYDIDGAGAAVSARQFVEILDLEAFAVSAGTLLDISTNPNGSGVRFDANNTPYVEGDPLFTRPGQNITGLPGRMGTSTIEAGYPTGDMVRAELIYDTGLSSLRFKLGDYNWSENFQYTAFYGINFGSQVPFENTEQTILCSIGDRVWHDVNVNGQQDEGELGVSGVTVELYSSIGGEPSGEAIATTSSDSNGLYSFSNILPGDYLLKFIGPEGSQFTKVHSGDDSFDSDVSTAGLSAVYSLASGDNINSVDAGILSPSSISGNVYHDEDNDGLFTASESGIGGVTLQLTGTDAFGNAVTLFATTAEDGSYLFTDLVPGTYSIAQIQPEGWNDGTDSLGSAGGTLSNDLISGINLLSGVDATNYNFGEVLPTPPPQDPIVAPGVRTPGFWGSNTWSKFWDGVADNEPKQAGTRGFPVGDLLFAPYKSGTQGTQRDPVTGGDRAGLLIGDWNRNGITDAGEQTLFYKTKQALNIINASTKPNTGDTRYILGRSLNAAWLNYVAGNPVDTAAVGDRDARHWINAGIAWLQRHTPDENGDTFGDGSLTSLASPAIRSSNAAWSTPITGGNAIHTNLDRYNNGLGGLADGLFSGG
jgi:hypothetical protein